MHDNVIMDAIGRSTVLGGLGNETVKGLASVAEPLQVAAEATLTWQGYEGDLVYLVTSGTASVERDGQQVAVLGPGDLFGEIGVLDHAPRNAAIHARTRMSLLTFPAAGFAALMEADEDLRARIERQAEQRRARPAAPA